MRDTSLNTVGEWIAGLSVLGAIAAVLPPLAALLGVLWYCIQIWESKTGRYWRSRLFSSSRRG